MSRKRKVMTPEQAEVFRTKEFFDMISPGVIKFMTDHYIVGDSFRCVWVIREYPPTTETQAILSQLADRSGVTLRMYHRLVDSAEQRKIVQNATRRNKLMSTGNDVTETIQAEGNLQDVVQLLAELRKNREPLLHCAVFLELRARSTEQLKELQQDIAMELTRSKITVDRLTLRQKEGFLSVLPTGSNQFGAQFERVLPASSVANAKLLMRRNYEIAVSEQLGFYNDMFGNLPATEEWLTWLRSGGSQETAGLPLTLQPVEQPGRTAPVGGELASDVPMEDVLGESFGELLSSLTASGVTFLGPNVPDLCDARIAGALDSVLRRMGYRIYVSELQMQYSFVSRKLNISLTWTNSGNAGFFFDWPVTLYLYDANHEPVYWEELDLDLRELNARDRLTVQTQVSLDEALRDEFYLGIGITDYSGSIRLPLAYDMGEDPLYIGDTQILYHYQKEAN